jgi:HK97 family phage major capsid protein/HK97 family phage prohead protease
MDRAYSWLEIKSIDDDLRVFRGMATTPAKDRVGDIVEPSGGRFKNPTPLLHQHKADSPVGEVTFGKATPKGIPFEARIPKIADPGPLKDRVDTAWGEVKAKLVRAVSIGFSPRDDGFEVMKDGGIRYTDYDILELSLVTIPANAEATITTIKAYDTNAPAATGTASVSTSAPVKISLPASRGSVKALPIHYKPGPPMLIEQIKQFENTRAVKDARRTDLMNKSAKEGTTLDDAESEEYDTLSDEIVKLDKHIGRLRQQEEQNKAAAVAVDPTPTTKAASGNRGPVLHASVKANVPKGIGFARYAMALAACKGNRYEAADYAKSHWPDQPEVQILLKAAVAAGTTTDATWAGPLAVAQPLVDEFLEMLRPATLIGKIPGLRRVPFNVSMPAQTAGGTYSWTGQGSAKPVSALAFSTVSLPFAKATGLIVISKELAKLSNPSAQEIVRNDMIAGMQTFLDTQFVDSTVAAVANVSPASITNGVAGTAASGTTEAAARADIRALINTFNTNNFGLAGVVLIMSESVAFTLGTIVNAVGEVSFPGITAQGGSLLGIPVVTSNVVGAQIIAVHAPSVLYADDGQTEIDVSEEASIQMDSAPANPSDATTVLVSMFQRNLVALRCDRFITWLKARANTVQRITTVAYV